MPEMRKVASSIGLTHIPAFLSARSRASSGPAHLVICVHGTPSSASSEALQSLCAPIAQHSARILLMQQIIVERVTPPATAARAHARAFMVDLRGYSAPLSSARAARVGKGRVLSYRLVRQVLTNFFILELPRDDPDFRLVRRPAPPTRKARACVRARGTRQWLARAPTVTVSRAAGRLLCSAPTGAA
jgi:hypothetical protein